MKIITSGYDGDVHSNDEVEDVRITTNSGQQFDIRCTASGKLFVKAVASGWDGIVVRPQSYESIVLDTE